MFPGTWMASKLCGCLALQSELAKDSVAARLPLPSVQGPHFSEQPGRGAREAVPSPGPGRDPSRSCNIGKRFKPSATIPPLQIKERRAPPWGSGTILRTRQFYVNVKAGHRAAARWTLL